MLKVNVAAVAQMTKMEKASVEKTYSNLIFSKGNAARSSGSRSMRRSPEQIVMGRNKSGFAERQAAWSYKELFHLADEIHKRTGLWLIGFIKKEDMTPANARDIWRELYQTINVLELNTAIL